MALADTPARDGGDPTSDSTADSGREELVEKLRRMADSLERGEDAEFGQQLQQLMQRREAGFFHRIEALSGLLVDAFRLDTDGSRLQGIQLELPDTAARLEHVVRLTSEAANRVLDLAEAGQRQLLALHQALTTLQADERPAVQTLASEMHTQCQGLRRTLGDVVQAQEFQDLSGQLLRRAGGVIREVEQGLHKLLQARPQARAESADSGLQGPVVPGVTSAGTDQADADALLAMFMPGA